ncbi:hypothetical protein LH51_06350 [Nitrincola sp. A-D6]|uniref:hypothetical protein n=1 Tax=Nitrincola sp. A-D6 TaxID=1545442 RepID=UPI00051FA351|nr:hypothetical protein [Nitrincola sp. A-D6]KGK42546.1 hypothetical protein LH51_06350 [Nitrincola sp. A-D6]
MRGFLNISSFCLSLGLASLPLQAGMITAADQSHLTLTLYNQDLAMIQDQRRLPALSPGQRIRVDNVSHQMLPETLRIQGAGQILEQSLLQSPLSYHALLQAHLGKFIQLARVNQATGQETISTVELLSIEQQTLIRRDGRIESIPMHSSEWRFIFLLNCLIICKGKPACSLSALVQTQRARHTSTTSVVASAGRWTMYLPWTVMASR